MKTRKLLFIALTLIIPICLVWRYSFLASAIVGLLALISGAIGFGIAWHSRRRDGRDRFITAISEIEAVLDTCTKIDSKTTKIHSDSVASLRPEVFRVQAYVSAGCFKGLLELWHKYEAENTTITEECRRAFQIPGAPKPEPVYARDRVLEYLRQMKQLVK